MLQRLVRATPPPTILPSLPSKHSLDLLHTIRSHLHNGTLLPTPLITPFVQTLLHSIPTTTPNNDENNNKHSKWILDGFPRDSHQAHSLLYEFDEKLRPDLYIVLRCHEDVLRKRLGQRGREDDEKHVIDKRLDDYFQGEQEVLKVINGGVEGHESVVEVESGKGREVLEDNVWDVVRKGGFGKVCVVGAPGSGKGVVGECLGRKGGLVHVSVGDVLRRVVRDDGDDSVGFAQVLRMAS